MHYLPMFAFYLFAFLLLAVVLAVAAFLAFKSGAQGQTKLGGCAGCAIAFALLLVAGLGALAIGFVALVHVQNEAVRSGPISKIHLDFPDEDTTTPTPPTLPDGSSGSSESSPDGLRRVAPGSKSLKLVIELRGTDASHFVEVVREKTHPNDQIRVQERTDASGRRFTTIEIEIPLDEGDRSDLQELEQSLREAIPGLKLPRGATIEFKTDDD